MYRLEICFDLLEFLPQERVPLAQELLLVKTPIIIQRPGENLLSF